jgi:hypothetical protein
MTLTHVHRAQPASQAVGSTSLMVKFTNPPPMLFAASPRSRMPLPTAGTSPGLPPPPATNLWPHHRLNHLDRIYATGVGLLSPKMTLTATAATIFTNQATLSTSSAITVKSARGCRPHCQRHGRHQRGRHRPARPLYSYLQLRACGRQKITREIELVLIGKSGLRVSLFGEGELQRRRGIVLIDLNPESSSCLQLPAYARQFKSVNVRVRLQ